MLARLSLLLHRLGLSRLGSLRLRLMALVLATLIPAGLLIFQMVADQRRHLAEDAQNQALQWVQLASRDQQEIIDTARQLLVALAQAPAIRQSDPQACNAMLAEVIRQSTGYINLLVAGADGQIRCHGAALDHAEDVRQESWFHEALRQRTFVLGEYQFSAEEGLAEIHLAYPILNSSGQVESVLTAGLDLRHMKTLLEKADLPEQATVMVIDRQGTILSYLPDAENWVGRSIAGSSVLKQILAQNAGTAEGPGLDGQTWLFAFTPLAGAPRVGDAYMLASVPATVAYAHADESLGNNLIGLGLVGLLGLGLAVVVGENLIMRRVKDLTQATRRLAQGDLTTRTGLPYGLGELSELSRHFDQMAGALQQRAAERASVERELRHERDFSSAIIDTAGSLVLVLDTDGGIVRFNQACERLSGYAAQDVIGRAVWDFLLAPDQVPAAQAIFESLAEEQFPQQYENQWLTRGGETRIIAWNNTALHGPDGAVRYLIAIGLDVTDRRRAEAALEDSRGQLQDFLDNANDLVQTVATGGHFVYVNQAWLKTLGYTQADLANLRLFDVLDPEDEAEYQIHLAQVLDGIVLPNLQVTFRARDGRRVILEGSLNYRFEAGQPVSTRAIFRDVTARRLAEAQQRLATQRAEALAHVAGRLNAQLELDKILQAVCEETSLALHVPAAAVYLSDDPQGDFRLAASHGLSAEYTAQAGPVARADYTALAQRQGWVTVLADAPSVPNWPDASLNAAHQVRTLAVASLVRDGRLAGFISAYPLGQVRTFSDDELVLLQGLADQTLQAIQNAHLLAATRRHLRQQEALRRIDHSISASLDLRLTLEVILAESLDQLRVDAAAVLLLEDSTQLLHYAAGLGFRTDALRHTELRLGEGHAGRAALERRTVVVDNLQAVTDSFSRSPLIVMEGFHAYHGVPLVAKGAVQGVLEVFHRQPDQPDQEWNDFLQALAGQAAIAIDNAGLFQNLQRSNLELSLAYDTTLEGWSRAMDLRDHNTEGHSQRTTELAMRLARGLGLSETDLPHLRRGALLHDIGKMGVPDAILLKTGPLTPTERTVMEQHPIYAYQMLAPIRFLQPALDIPHYHHERWNGAGYPEGRSGEQIPLPARIFAVVDVWDALISDRPYRAAWSEEKVRAYLQERAGIDFDPHVVRVFLEVLDSAPEGGENAA